MIVESLYALKIDKKFNYIILCCLIQLLNIIH